LAEVKYKSASFVCSLLLDSVWSAGERQKVKSTSVPWTSKEWGMVRELENKWIDLNALILIWVL
jgi:hypothetical protein